MIYAVHKRTKEHRVISDAARYGAEEWRYVDADPDGWIEWQGGECPLPDDCFVQIKTNIGIPNEGRADEFRWARQSRHGDIIAYRPILDSGTKPAECAECEGVRLTAFGDDCPACCKPEPSAWDGEGLPPAGCECEVEYAELGNWIRAKVIGYDGPACVVAIDGHGYFGSRNPSEFRPILNADTKVSHPGTMAGPDKFRADGGEPPARDGEGLPPVGCECEVRHLHSTDLEWRIIKITAITNDYVVGYIRDDRESAIRRGPLLEFRPIRSEEDRITEELERIMYKPAMTREMAARIYEAIRDGKVPGVKLAGGE